MSAEGKEMKRETNISTLRSKLMSSLLMGSSDESSYKSTNSSSSSSSKQDVKALAVAYVFFQNPHSHLFNKSDIHTTLG